MTGQVEREYLQNELDYILRTRRTCEAWDFEHIAKFDHTIEELVRIMNHIFHESMRYDSAYAEVVTEEEFFKRIGK